MAYEHFRARRRAPVKVSKYDAKFDTSENNGWKGTLTARQHAERDIVIANLSVAL